MSDHMLSDEERVHVLELAENYAAAIEDGFEEEIEEAADTLLDYVEGFVTVPSGDR